MKNYGVNKISFCYNLIARKSLQGSFTAKTWRNLSGRSRLLGLNSAQDITRIHYRLICWCAKIAGSRCTINRCTHYLLQTAYRNELEWVGSNSSSLQISSTVELLPQDTQDVFASKNLTASKAKLKNGNSSNVTKTISFNKLWGTFTSTRRNTSAKFLFMLCGMRSGGLRDHIFLQRNRTKPLLCMHTMKRPDSILVDSSTSPKRKTWSSFIKSTPWSTGRQLWWLIAKPSENSLKKRTSIVSQYSLVSTLLHSGGIHSRLLVGTTIKTVKMLSWGN